MIELRPWDPSTPRPSDARHVVGCWDMAKLGSEQHPHNVRALWRDDRDGQAELVAMGGLVEVSKDALAFFWLREGAPPLIWRRLKPALAIGLQMAHERGVRRIFAVVVAAHVEAVRFIRALGFVFWNNETGWPHTAEPVLRYLHAWPAIEEPPLVAFLRGEQERACLNAWCPSFSEGGLAP